MRNNERNKEQESEAGESTRSAKATNKNEPVARDVVEQ